MKKIAAHKFMASPPRCRSSDACNSKKNHRMLHSLCFFLFIAGLIAGCQMLIFKMNLPAIKSEREREKLKHSNQCYR
jgi:hypothetical protein